jgi:hypothetical protein
MNLPVSQNQVQGAGINFSAVQEHCPPEKPIHHSLFTIRCRFGLGRSLALSSGIMATLPLRKKPNQKQNSKAVIDER